MNDVSTPVAAPTATPTPVCDVRCVVEATLRDEGLGWLWDNGWAPRVVQCESGFDPRASNHGQFLGLWQIWIGWYGAPHYLAGPWDDPEANTKAAAYIYRAQGPSAWACRPW